MTATLTPKANRRDLQRRTEISCLLDQSDKPYGFEAGDANLYRYVGNEVTNATDPDGLITFGGSGNQRIHLGPIHAYYGPVIDVGWGPGGPTWGVGISGGVGIGVGLGTTVGTSVCMTSADTVSALSGPSFAGGINVGVIAAGGIEILLGSGYVGVGGSIPPMPGGGIGGGAYMDIRGTCYIFGNTEYDDEPTGDLPLGLDDGPEGPPIDPNPYNPFR